MMKKWIQFFKHKAYEFRSLLFSQPYALLSGILVGTSYIPFPPWALIFCYAPLWLSVTDDQWLSVTDDQRLSVTDEKTSVKKAFWAGWLPQFTLTLIGF